MPWAILVIWQGGEEEYLKSGRGLPSDRIATWAHRGHAEEHADFLRMGVDDVQFINVVRAPRGVDG